MEQNFIIPTHDLGEKRRRNEDGTEAVTEASNYFIAQQRHEPNESTYTCAVLMLLHNVVSYYTSYACMMYKECS